jgi:hypothetical protein
VRAIEEGAQLGDTLLVLEGATAGDHEKASNLRGLSAQGEEFIGDAPTTARAEVEETETASEGTAWSAPAVSMTMSVSMTEGCAGYFLRYAAYFYRFYILYATYHPLLCLAEASRLGHPFLENDGFCERMSQVE